MTFRHTSYADEIEDLHLSGSIIDPEVEDVVASDTPEKLSASQAVTAAKFDYSGMGSDVAAEAEEVAARIRSRLRASLIDTGKDLLAVKAKLPHGTFGKWLEFHFGMAERTAQNLMNVAKAFAKTPEVAERLPPTLVYKLAAQSTSEEIRDSVVEEIRTGGQPNAKKVAALIARAKSDHHREGGEESTNSAGQQTVTPTNGESNVEMMDGMQTSTMEVDLSMKDEFTIGNMSPTQKAQFLMRFLSEKHPKGFTILRKIFLDCDLGVLRKLMSEAQALDNNGARFQ